MPAPPAHYLPSSSADPADLVASEDWLDISRARLAKAIAKLDERSRDIISARWLNEDKTTLMDLAERYGVSAERIRQLEKNALKKLKAAVAIDEAPDERDRAVA